MKFLINIILSVAYNIVFSQTTTYIQTAGSLKTGIVKVMVITSSMDFNLISINIEKTKAVSSYYKVEKGSTATPEVKYNPDYMPEKEIFQSLKIQAADKIRKKDHTK